jgi:hypothetical protein
MNRLRNLRRPAMNAGDGHEKKTSLTAIRDRQGRSIASLN